MKNGNKIIIGIPAMAGFLKVSEPTVYEYIKKGMPGGKICGRWHFHIDNVNLFFQSLTGKSHINSPDEYIMEEKIFDPEKNVNPKNHIKNT